MEAWGVHPNLHTVAHQLVHVVKHAVGCERNIAMRRHHDLNLDASLDGLSQCPFQSAVQREIRVDELDAVSGVIDGIGIETTNDAVGGVRLAVDDSHHLMMGGGACVGL